MSVSHISKAEIKEGEAIQGQDIRDGIFLLIKLLSEKIDHLLVHQNKKLLEIQELQTDYLEDLMKELKGLKRKQQ